MPASEALRIDRAKDAIEKLFHSLKSEIEIKPVRVWSEDAVHGVLLIGFSTAGDDRFDTTFR